MERAWGSGWEEQLRLEVGKAERSRKRLESGHLRAGRMGGVERGGAMSWKLRKETVSRRRGGAAATRAEVTEVAEKKY